MIINCTNIGKRPSGIGKTSLSLSRYLLENWDRPFVLFINSQALGFFRDIKHREKIRVSTEGLSPDRGFRGNMKRLIWANSIGRERRGELVFNASQMEGSLWHKRQIITVYDLIPLECPELHRRQFIYFRYVLPKVLKNSLRVIAISNYTKDAIVERYGIPEEKIKVIYPGVDRAFTPAGESEKGNYILYVGRLAPTKNIARLIRAFELFLKEYRVDVKLKMTGRAEELKVEIDKETIKKIDFLGDVSEEELARLYRGAALFVFPSLYEGFGLPPLEAMASGCPVVVSRAASLPEVCADGAYYVDPMSVEDIAEGMYRVLSDETLRKELRKKGLERAKRFSWDRAAGEYIRVFEETSEYRAEV